MRFIPFGDPLPGKRCKCERCGFDGFHAPDQRHVCMVMVNLDELERHKRDAARFIFLQNLPVVKAQAYFWNHASRKQRAAEIDADMRSVIENIQERK